MRSTRFLKAFSRVAIIACLTIPATAQAQDAPKQAFCAEGERYYPEGLIGQIGAHYFRICTGRFTYPPLDSEPSLDIDTEQRLDAYAAQNFPDIKELIARIRDHYGNLRPYPAGLRDHSEKVGQIELGDLTYMVLVFKSSLSRLTFPVSKENMPKEFDLFFPGSEARDIPEHLLFCPPGGDPMNAPEMGYYCFLYVRYTPSEDLYIEKPILHIPTEKPSAIINTRVFDFDRLALFAQQLRDAYRYIEVTDQLDELKDVPKTLMPE